MNKAIRAEVERRKKAADVWYVNLGFVAVGAPLLALVMTWGM